MTKSENVFLPFGKNALSILVFSDFVKRLCGSNQSSAFFVRSRPGCEFFICKVKRMQEQTETKLTGYPSIDKPWLKYYSEEAINAPLPQCTLYDYLWENNKDHLNDVALNYFDRKITYGELFKNIKKAANGLFSIGVREGDIVTVFSVNTPETIYSLYALNLLGAIPNMEYITESGKEAVSAIEKCKSETIIILDALLPRFSCVATCDIVKSIVVLPVCRSMPTVKRVLYHLKAKRNFCIKGIMFDAMIKCGIPCQKAEYQAGKTAVIVHSGGTTGVPKGVALSNDSLNYIAWIFKNNENDSKRGDTWLCAIPAFHAFGLAMGIIFPLSRGMQLILVVKYNDQELVRLFIKHKPNHIMGSGAHIPSIQENKKIQKMDLSFFKTCGLGGTPLSVSKEKELIDFLAARGSTAKASIGYGMSETSSAISTELNRYYGKPGSCGIILCKSNVKVVEQDGYIEQPYGQTGELLFSGPGVMTEYYQNKEETAHALFVDEFGIKWVRSGDLGYVDEDGFLFITGRVKRIYSTRSEKNGTIYKLFPDYVAKVILQVPNIEDCAVVCIDDPDYKTIAIAYVVVNTAFNLELIKKAIENHVSEVLPSYCVPKRVCFIKSIPLTPIGKIDFQALEHMAKGIDT